MAHLQIKALAAFKLAGILIRASEVWSLLNVTRYSPTSVLSRL
jgi:hypothetical protein